MNKRKSGAREEEEEEEGGRGAVRRPLRPPAQGDEWTGELERTGGRGNHASSGGVRHLFPPNIAFQGLGAPRGPHAWPSVTAWPLAALTRRGEIKQRPKKKYMLEQRARAGAPARMWRLAGWCWLATSGNPPLTTWAGQTKLFSFRRKIPRIYFTIFHLLGLAGQTAIFWKCLAGLFRQIGAPGRRGNVFPHRLCF